MDARTREILGCNDSPTDWEYPPDFDWKASMRSVVAFKPFAEQILGQPLTLDDQVQDASYFAELSVLKEGEMCWNDRSQRVLHTVIAIRFSAFGKMATICTSLARSELSALPLQALAELLAEHGYIYVDAEALDEPYDGKLKGLHDRANWFVRFFDYL